MTSVTLLCEDNRAYSIQNLLNLARIFTDAHFLADSYARYDLVTISEGSNGLIRSCFCGIWLYVLQKMFHSVDNSVRARIFPTNGS